MCMENVVREQVQQHFPWESTKLSANSSCHVNLLFIGRSLKRGNFAIFDKLFRFRFFYIKKKTKARPLRVIFCELKVPGVSSTKYTLTVMIKIIQQVCLVVIYSEKKQI